MTTRTRTRGHGEGSIFRRGDGLWVAAVNSGRDERGRRKRKVFYGRTRHDVQEKLKPALRAQQQGLPLASDRQTVGAYLLGWLETVRTSLRPRTWLRYEQYVRLHALPTIGHLTLAQLGPQHLRTVYAHRIEAGLSAMSVGHLHAVLHTALRQAERDGIVPRNVVALTTPPRAPRHAMQTLEPEQARAFLTAAIGDRLEALYTLAITTGMRQGELLGLRWRDVDLDAGSVRVQASLQRSGDGFVLAEPKTARSRRQITLGTAAIASLRRWRARQAEERFGAGRAWIDTGLVFTNPLGENVAGQLRTAFPALLARAGLARIRFHDLRHSAATLMLALGEHPKIVSEMLGHSTIAITLDLYSHVTPTMQRGAADRLDALLHA